MTTDKKAAIKITPVSVWTDALVEKITALRMGGKTARQIAVEIGVSRNAVIGKLFRLGIKGDGPRMKLPASAKPYKPRASRAKRKAGDLVSTAPRPFHPEFQPVRVFHRVKQYRERPQPTAKGAAPGPETAVTLKDIKPDQCRYVGGDIVQGHGDTALMCGATVSKPHAAYCAYHHNLCYMEPIPSRAKAEGQYVRHLMKRYS